MLIGRLPTRTNTGIISKHVMSLMSREPSSRETCHVYGQRCVFTLNKLQVPRRVSKIIHASFPSPASQLGQKNGRPKLHPCPSGNAVASSKQANSTAHARHERLSPCTFMSEPARNSRDGKSPRTCAQSSSCQQLSGLVGIFNRHADADVIRTISPQNDRAAR